MKLTRITSLIILTIGIGFFSLKAPQNVQAQGRGPINPPGPPAEDPPGGPPGPIQSDQLPPPVVDLLEKIAARRGTKVDTLLANNPGYAQELANLNPQQVNRIKRLLQNIDNVNPNFNLNVNPTNAAPGNNNGVTDPTTRRAPVPNIPRN